MNGIKHCIPSLLVALLLIITSLNPLIDNVFAEPGSTNDSNPTYIPEDGIQDEVQDDKNGTKVKIKDIIKDRIINLLHNTWSYNLNASEVQVNVTGDRTQLLILHPDAGNVTLDMNFTYGKGKTFTKTKDKEKISYKTSDLNMTFAANTSALKEVIVVEKEKEKLFPLNWSVNVTSEWDMDISRNDRTIQVGGVDVFWLQPFTAVNATNGTVSLNETYSEGNSSFNISLDLGEVVDKDDYPLTIDPTVTIDVTDAIDLSNRNIAVNSSGVMYTAYFDGSLLEYQKSTDDGETWGSATTVSDLDDYVRQVVMCIDTDDNLHFLWKESTSISMHRCYWVGNSTWSDPFNVRDETGNWNDIVSDGSGNVYAFYGTYTGMEWRKWDGDSWGAEGLIRADQGTPDEAHPEAAVSSNGTIHLTWQGTDGAGKGIYYSRSTDGSTWSTPTQIDGDLGGAWQPSISVDSNDDLHVIYMGKNASHDYIQIVYLKYDASETSWSSEEYLTDLSTTTHRYPTIAVDSNDTLYSIWSNAGVAGGSNGQIDYRYSTDGGATWSSPTTLLDRTYDTRHPQALHNAYPDGVGNVPETGFMFSYKEDWLGTPDYTIYYSANWSLSSEPPPNISITDEHPQNLSYSYPQPWCYATVNRTGGGEFNVTFWENSTGSWVNRQGNNSVENGTFWWQFTQASSFGTDYWWKVRAENGSDNQSSIFQFMTFQEANATGEPVTNLNLFYYSDGSIIDTYDLINDTANYTIIFSPYRESAGWIANDASGITKVDDTWYIVHRLRTGDTDRGHFLLLNSSTDLTTWPSVWNVSIDDISPASQISFEKASIRYYNDFYYLYFCADTGVKWSTYYIKSDTAADLEYSVKNSDNWTLIKAGAKDPEVVYHNGTYYFITSDGMYQADNPEASGKTFIVDFTQLFTDEYGVVGNNTGTIMFDNTSGYFIYWRGVRVDFDDDSNVDDILWYFAVSADMETWEAVDRHVKVKNYTEDSGTLRYPAYFVTENETVCILEWEDEVGAGYRSVVLWVYDEGPASNDPPEFSSESPSNESIGISLQPWCSIQVNDTENDTIVVNFYENSTGSWVHRQTNNSVVEDPDWSNNGTYWWQFTQASVQSTQYWWNVTADDGTTNVSVTYTFNTNTASTQSDPHPINETTEISLQPWCDITVNDLEGDSMTVNWYENSTDVWIIRQTNSTASNGTYWWQFTQVSDYLTLYYWRVDVLDGEFNTSVMYEFTTSAEQLPPEVTVHSPTNNSIGIDTQPWCYVTINDTNGDYMNLTWFENSTGSWVNRQTNSSVLNGTYWWQFSQADENSTLYYWRVNVTDDDLKTTVIYHFTTSVPPEFSSESPTNESSGIQKQPWCNVQVNDTDGETFDITWEENSTGGWVVRQQNLTASNGTFWWRFTQATEYLTRYYWKVSANDGVNNNTTIYYFDLLANTPPVGSSPFPSNESSGIELTPTCRITVSDTNGDLMNISWLENTTGPWIERHADTGASDGEYTFQITQFSSELTTYYWRINLTDGTDNVTYIFHFTTLTDNLSPEISNPTPVNETTEVSLSPWCNITIEDPEGDTFDITFEENSTGSWIIRQQNLTSSNGTFWWHFTQATGRGVTYYWNVSADDGYTNNTTTFEFTTEVNNNPQTTSPYPTNSSTGIYPYEEVYFNVSDADFDDVNISWLENSTGDWIERKLWSNQQPGIFYWNFTQANLPLTTYYWKVNVTDGFNNTTTIYHYTTIISEPIISNEYPETNAEDIYQPICEIDVMHPYGSLMNVTFSELITPFEWILRQTNSSVGNGTYTWNFTQAYNYSSGYVWRVRATDLDGNKTTELYGFTTPDIEAHFTYTKDYNYVYFTNNTSNINTDSGNYCWTFGDGSGYSNDENPTHYYNLSGNYYVTMNVSDGHGQDSYSEWIQVTVNETLYVEDVDQWDSIYQVMLWAVVLVIVVGLFNVIRRFGYQLVRDFT